MTSEKKWRLPVEAYTSQEWFDKEQELLFSKVWQFAGMLEDIPNVGDHLCVRAGLQPLIVVRGEDNELKAFYNICRHRGTELLRTTGKSKKMIVCPYHHWVYGLDGELKSVPSQKEFPGLDKSQMGLHPASVTAWKGMIFVHPEVDAPPLSEWLADLPDHMGPHQPEKLVEYDGVRYQYDIKANWKIFIENYMDGYHLAHLHADTLNMYEHKSQRYTYAGRHWTFFEPLSKSYKKNLHKVAPMPVIDHIPDENIGAYVHMLFPNFGITETEVGWTTLNITPIAPNRTLVDIRVRTMPMTTTQYNSGWMRWSKWSKVQEPNPDADDPLESHDVMLEDIYACEQQQSAMRSPKFEVGAVAETLERSILEYQAHYLDFMEK
ncbi:MAG: aromatic ring-hydroxylating dioxygenase subunit alpha [Anaerolineae bacterium]|jgi:Rieske 2Fe-2S family protein|nr:aromatic ring-hydroxylating dioxygenase subunit alpha [Anaerolineae bacterium]MBT7192236.1 aromatic ring-hydroxylating dioxygenase subunit alpha [Anaerolineae bacterium]